MNRRPTFSLINCYHYHCDHYCCYYFHNQQQQLHHHYLRNKSVSLDLPCPPPNHVVTYRGGKSQDTLCWNSVDVNGFLFLSLEQVGKQALHASPPANKSARQFLILSIHSASLSSLSLSLSLSLTLGKVSDDSQASVCAASKFCPVSKTGGVSNTFS